jgi:PST family polysaccharide transporter
MYGALLAGAVGLAIRALIVRDLGIEAAGIYQAAWALSGLFGAFVLQAMGTDFYPRLTAAASDDLQVTKLVNEQMEVGMLLALPGVLGAIVFAPWLMSLFYSKQFLAGGELLAWFAAGVFVQVVTWPLGMVQRAKGSTGWIIASQTHLNLLTLLLVFAGVRFFGLAAAAWAFVVAGAIHGFVVRFIARRLAQYHMSRECTVILLLSALAILLCSLVGWGITGAPAIITGGIVVVGSSVLCLRALARATGADSRLSVLIGRFPGAHFLLR